MTQGRTIEEVRAVKERYEEALMKRANVVGVGIGYKHTSDMSTDELAIVVNVREKKPLAQLAEKDVVPAQLEGIPTDVQEVGTLRAH